MGTREEGLRWREPERRARKWWRRELELGCGRGTERSEVPTTSPNRWAHGGEQGREMGGGGRLSAAWRKENGRERGPRA
jgi:hypothetical protein